MDEAEFATLLFTRLTGSNDVTADLSMRPVAQWEPNPGRQTEAYSSTADVIGYGGAAGGGKTDILLGFAFTKHHRSIVYRRHYNDLIDLIDRGDQILDGTASFVHGEKRRWDLPSGAQVAIGAVQHKKDLKKFQGRARDFIGVDEAAEFPEEWFRYLTGWLRTTNPGQTTRIVLTFNPPTTPEGEWIINYFAPWLKRDHPNPANPGEIRYFIRDDNQDVEVDGPEPVEIDGQPFTPQSRTFIPARVDDNPHLTSDYKSQLNMMPEPLRSQLLFGDFDVKMVDDPWQVIPTDWILAAQKRWREMDRPEVALRSIGSDPARGGDDNHVIARVFGTYFEVVQYAGRDTPDGPAGAMQIIEAMAGQDAPVMVDVIGIGSSVYDHVKPLVRTVRAVNNAAKASRHETDRQSHRFTFSNIRALSYWRLREALDPSSEENIALPDIAEVLTDLRAPRYSVVSGAIKIEPKENIKERIGRSPDYGDAIVLAWHGITNKVTLDWIDL